MKEPKKQLKAILFADIAGYTFLMQKDETAAGVLLRRFQKEVEEHVVGNNGQIINFYGDGALCIFENPLWAVRCAMVLQTAFNEAPQVPVRIGLHMGTVVYENDKVYGNSVNLASRIESMGVPGAVLLSKKVKEEISGELHIQVASLGYFEFKNVEAAMEVFVITNEGFVRPNRSDLKGKFKEHDPSGEREKSIGILAFENRSGDPEQEYFSDGITEEIIYALSKLDKLKVAGRASSFSFKGKNVDLIEVGNKLNVQNLLEGSVRKMGNRVRVTAQLVDATNGYQIWTERFDRELEDIFAIQDDIAQNIVEKLEVTLLQDQHKQPLVTKSTENIEAYQWYLRGRHYLDQRTLVDQAITCFQKALELDPDYALAHSGMAYAYFYQVVMNNHPPHVFLKTKESAQKAKALDPSIAEPYLMEGVACFYYDWNNEKALRQYEKALALNPNSYDAYRVKAYFHTMTNEMEEAERLARKAVELDPLNVNAQLSLGEILYRGKKFDEAIDVLLELNRLFPDNKVANTVLGGCYHYTGQVDKARSTFERVFYAPDNISFYSTTWYLYLLENGRKEEVSALLSNVEEDRSGKWFSPMCLALIHFKLGAEQKATAYLQKALKDRDSILQIAAVEPSWNAYREHPAVGEILAKRSPL